MKHWKFRLIALTAFVVIMSLQSKAQIIDDEFHYGFYAGATYTSIDDIKTTIIPNVFAPNTYETKLDRRLGYTVGFFVYERFKDSKFAIQPEISFSMMGGDFVYSDVNDLQYTMSFKYQYMSIATFMRVYPTGGLSLTLGPQVGFNIDNTNIDYSSNMPELGPDLQVQQSLREVLKGETDFSVYLGMGYEFESGLMIEGRYKVGIADVIETQSNGFNFSENRNRGSGFQLTIGYAIPFY